MTSPDTAARVRSVIETATTWPGATRSTHRYGGTEFRVGPREFGHVHEFGMVDIPYLRAVRDALIEEGLTDVHHLLTESGWTTTHLREDADVERAMWLLRLSYLYHVAALQRLAAPDPEIEGVDVATELDALAPSPAVRTAVERRRPA